jgi:hypothetical protein
LGELSPDSRLRPRLHELDLGCGEAALGQADASRPFELGADRLELEVACGRAKFDPAGRVGDA